MLRISVKMKKVREGLSVPIHVTRNGGWAPEPERICVRTAGGVLIQKLITNIPAHKIILVTGRNIAA